MLNAKERSEITRRVKAFRKMITNAAIKRKQRELKRNPPRQKLSTEQKIDMLRRRLQGGKIKDIAKAYNRNPQYLSGVIFHLVLDQMQGHWNDSQSEWHRCLHNYEEFYSIWAPLALERLENNIPSRRDQLTLSSKPSLVR